MNASADQPAASRGKTAEMEAEVLRRYGAAAETAEACLCAPAQYDARLLELIPEEIRQKDYGCGNPSKYVEPGETVVDLGSGPGKICYLLSQRVGAEGRVIGVDFNDKMLRLARKHQDEMARRIGYANMRFGKAKIQDLALDLERAQEWLDGRPVQKVEDLIAYEAECERLRREEPLIPDNSVDVVVSNCVLNLVREQDKRTLFAEIHRILRPGGRAVISDMVCDEEPTDAIRNDPELWSGCIAGTFREDVFLERFEDAGFYGVQILERQAPPRQVIEGIEFRGMTIQAFKGAGGPCLERNQAVVYTGPWKRVADDDGHTLLRGKRVAVCDKAFRLLTDPRGPYAKDIIGIEPREEIPLDQAREFACDGSALRDPRVTKGTHYKQTSSSNESECCGTSKCC